MSTIAIFSPILPTLSLPVVFSFYNFYQGDMIVLTSKAGGLIREERNTDGTLHSAGISIPPFKYHLSIQDDIVKADNPEYWTRVTIEEGAKYDKDEVLHTFMSFISPAQCTPVLYQIEGDDTFFLIRKGQKVVRKLLNSSCLIDGSDFIKEKLKVNVMILYQNIAEQPYCPEQDIMQVIIKRFNKIEGVLDLRDFKNDPGLKNMYLSLKWDTSLFRVIKSGMTSMKNTLKVLLLSHNELDELYVLKELKIQQYQLTMLDLRDNKITFSGFESIPALEVKHLLIEGNPLCNDFETPEEMAFYIKRRLTTLETLDNVDIDIFMEDKMRFKVYVRNPAYSSLVDHFLHHYYSLFEKDREKLVQTYQKDAQLSISISRSVIAGDFFNSSNRNLLCMSDVTKTYSNLYIGKLRILDALKSMPSISFDPYSFQVDVPITAKDELVVIFSTGAFCFNESVARNMYTFSRVSVLGPLRNGLGEWTIYNDMWTLTMSSDQTMEHFTKYDNPVKGDFAVMLNPQIKDKEILIRVVSELTSLKTAWVEKFLSESVWDLEMTLLAFTDQYKANLIPAEAFNPVGSGNTKTQTFKPLEKIDSSSKYLPS